MQTVQLPEDHVDRLTDQIENHNSSGPLLPVEESPADDEEPLPLYFHKAAPLVHQSMSGHHMPREVLEHKDYEKAKRAYLFYTCLSPIRIIAIVISILLPYVEEPFWLKREKYLGNEDLNNYPVSGIHYLSVPVFLVIQVLCFIPLTWSTVLEYKFQGLKAWKRKVFIYKVCCLVGMAFGMLQRTAEIFDFIFLETFNVSTYAHLLVPLIFQRTLRRAFFMELKLARDFMDIAALVIVFVLLSAWIATSIFNDYASYRNFPTSFLNLFILLTTSNSPDVWVPLYAKNRVTFLFFLLYVTIGVFFLMNMMFTVIYSSYKIQMKTELKNRLREQKGSLEQAFSLLDTNKQGWIDASTMKKLFLAIFQYQCTPNDHQQRMKLFLALDKKGNFRISKEEFEDVCHEISQEIAAHQVVSLFSKTMSSYISGLSGLQFSYHPLFHCAVWIVTLTGVIAAVYDLYFSGEQSNWAIMLGIEYLAGLLLVVSDIIMVLAMGWIQYWRELLNRCNLYITLLTVVLTIASIFLAKARQWIYVLLVARILCLFTRIKLFSRWPLVIQTIFELLPATVPILNVQYSLCSLFSLLGVQFFGGLIFVDNSALEGTSFSELEFWSLNYNDYASAVVTNFCLCVVNNWFIIMDAFVAATGSVWARIYFMSFWGLAVAFILNASIAFFVEAFVSQMKKMDAEKEGEVNNVAIGRCNAGNFEQQQVHLAKKSLSCYDIYANIIQS